MLKITLYFFAVIAIFIVAGLVTLNLAGKNAAEFIGDFKPVMKEIENGKYEGEYSFLLDKIGAEISFEVKEGRLVNYEFGRLYSTIGYGAFENVRSQIDKNNDLNFDAVSGATITSNFAKAAIKNALEKGPVE